METRLLKELFSAAIIIIVIAILIIPVLFVGFIFCIIAILVVAFCKIFQIQVPFQEFINTIMEENINEDYCDDPYDESNEEQYPYPCVEDIYEGF